MLLLMLFFKTKKNKKNVEYIQKKKMKMKFIYLLINRFKKINNKETKYKKKNKVNK